MPARALFTACLFILPITLMACGNGSDGATDRSRAGVDGGSEPKTLAPNVAPSYELTKPYPEVPYPKTANLEFDTFQDCGGTLPETVCDTEDPDNPDRLLELSVPDMTLAELNAWYDKYLPTEDTFDWSYCPEESSYSGEQANMARTFFKREPSPLNKYADDHAFSLETSLVSVQRTYDAETGEYGPTQAAGVSFSFDSDLVCLSEVPTYSGEVPDSSLPIPGDKVVVGSTAYVVRSADVSPQLNCGFGLGTTSRVDSRGRFIWIDLRIINEGPRPITISEDTGFLIDGKGNKWVKQAQKPIREECVRLHNLYKEVPPGGSLSGELIYDVPFEAVENSILRLKDQWSNKTIDIDLVTRYAFR